MKLQSVRYIKLVQSLMVTNQNKYRDVFYFLPEGEAMTGSVLGPLSIPERNMESPGLTDSQSRMKYFCCKTNGFNIVAA